MVDDHDNVPSASGWSVGISYDRASTLSMGRSVRVGAGAGKPELLTSARIPVGARSKRVGSAAWQGRWGRISPMAETAAREREFKFDADFEFDPPDLRPLVGRTVRLAAQTYSTAYFDTADQRLRDLGLSLRHRQADVPPGDAVAAPASGARSTQPYGTWTLKLPLKGPAGRPALERNEYNWTGRRERIPAGVRRVLAGAVRREPLALVAELSAERRRLTLERPDSGHAWAEIDDDLVEVTAGPGRGLRFRQMELEILDENAVPARELEKVLESLRRAGAAPSTTSKLALALGSDVAAGRANDAAPAPVEAIQAVITRDFRRVLIDDLRVRLDGGRPGGPDAGDVHRARVGLRRLRSNLNGFAGLLDPIWLGHVNDDLLWLGRAHGSVRNLDVLGDRLAAHPETTGREGVRELLRLVAADRKVAACRLSEVLGDPRCADVFDRLHAAGHDLPGVEGSTRCKASAAGRAAMSALSSRAEGFITKLGSLPSPPDDHDLHRLGVEAKRLRYAAEAARPHAGKKAARTAKAARQAHSVLGEAHDAAMAAQWLREACRRGVLGPSGAFAAGWLAAEAEAEHRGLAPKWQKAVRKLAGPPARRWIA